MKKILLIISLLISTISFGKEISKSLNNKLQKMYINNEYTKGFDIIKNIETPTSTSYKKNGEYKDSKSLYMWKVIFMYKTNTKINSIIPEFIYYKNIGGEINSDILKEVKYKLSIEYVNDFKNKYETICLRESEFEKMEEIMINIFNIDIDTISSKNFQDYRKFKSMVDIIGVNDTIIDIDTFNYIKVEQSYKSVLNFVNKFNYQGNNVEKISKALTNPFKTEELKVFAIICFIIKNIEYDYVYGNYISPNQKFSWGVCLPKDILLYKKTVCQGYATLFDKLCTFSNIKSGMIGGEGHAFNWVLINGTYNILDVTWLDHESSEKMNELDVMNNIHYPKPYKQKLNYIFIMNHYPYYLFQSNVNESYSYNGKGEYKTQYGLFNNIQDMDILFKKLKKEEICKIYGIKRLPNIKEYSFLKSINSNTELETEMKKLGIL